MNETLIFDKEISSESVANLIQMLENISHQVDENGNIIETSKITLYFSTPGGECGATNMLLKYMSEYPIPIEIVLFGDCSSAGFIFALLVEQDVTVLNSAFSLVHLGTISVESRELDNSESFSYFCKNVYTKKINKYFSELYKEAGLTEYEYNSIIQGKDVYFESDRLKEVLDVYRSKQTIKAIDEEIKNVKSDLEMLDETKKSLKDKINEIMSRSNSRKSHNKKIYQNKKQIKFKK